MGVPTSQLRSGRNSQNAVAASARAFHNLLFRFASRFVPTPNRCGADFRPDKNPARFWQQTFRKRNLPAVAVLAELPPSGQHRPREGEKGVRHTTDFRNHLTNRFSGRTSCNSIHERLVVVDAPLVIRGERPHKTLCACVGGPQVQPTATPFPSLASRGASMRELWDVLDFHPSGYCGTLGLNTLGFAETTSTPLLLRERPLR